MVLALLLAIIQAYISLKRFKEHSHLHSISAKLASFILLSLPLLVGFTFPTVTLDSQTVTAKGYYFPLSEETDKAIQASEGTSSQYLKPDTSRFYSHTAYVNTVRNSADKYLSQSSIVITDENYLEIMEVIYDFPNEFEGKEIEFTGFVYNDPNHANSQFVFRFGIMHCIADSGVFGLLTTGNTNQYENNTWVRVKGNISNHYHKELNQVLPTLEVQSFIKVDKPDNPYVYKEFYKSSLNGLLFVVSKIECLMYSKD